MLSSLSHILVDFVCIYFDDHLKLNIFLTGILGCMTKLGKSCILRIAPSHLYFIVRESQTISSSPLIWCTLEEGHFFSEYGMEGLSAVDNEIYLEFVAGIFLILLGNSSSNFFISCFYVSSLKMNSRKCYQNIECSESI